MSGRYLPVRPRGSAAIAVCPRCAKKVYYDALQKDPNNGNYYCKGCVDALDPWRLPARQPEDITLQHPRPDTQLTLDETDIISTELDIEINFPPEVST